MQNKKTREALLIGLAGALVLIAIVFVELISSIEARH